VPEGFAGGRRVETSGVDLSGLIDLHKNVAYNCLSLHRAISNLKAWMHDPPRGL
jgi:hypothetical protein